MKQGFTTQEKQITDLIRGLKGVINLEKLGEDQLAAVKERCLIKERNGFVDIVFSGLEGVLGREEVWILLKDAHFRPPPEKTVYMVEDVEKRLPGMENILSLGERHYHIIGEEIFEGEPEPEEAHFFLSDGFVLFTERREGRKPLPAYFLLPPIPFPELEERKEDLGIGNIVSFSPPGTLDKILREMFEFDLSPEYATLLIGMDRREDL